MPEAFPHTAVQCLTAIAQHHGLQVNPERLVHDYALGAEEPAPALFLRMASDIGLKAKAERLDWNALVALQGVFPLVARDGGPATPTADGWISCCVGGGTVHMGAMLLRMAPSHVRFGTFEVFYYRRQYDRVRQLADYVVGQHYGHLAGRADRYAALLMEVAERTGTLIARWQAVGFAHGVMNSDNMSILGLTLDYGPFGFLDEYHPGFICNYSDRYGRYAFHHQQDIGYFNLRCLAQALSPLLSEDQVWAALGRYEAVFGETYWSLMRGKLGLVESKPEDHALITDLLAILQANRVDYTNFFRALAGFEEAPGAGNEPLRDLFVDRGMFDDWACRYGARLSAEESRAPARKERMNRMNPKYILRNYLAQVAIDRATQDRDFTEIERLRVLLRDPYGEQPEMERYAAPPPAWASHIVVSCSS